MARDIIVIGASAGGVEALRTLVGGFPPDWNAAVLVAMHLPSDGVSAMPAILSRAGPLPARNPEDGEMITPGTIEIAPPGFHMVLIRGRVRLVHGTRRDRPRPSVDTLFRSAAHSAGPRVIGVVLTGTLSDGAAGLQAIRERGGMAIVQDPADARFPSMPRHALENVRVDHCVPLLDMASLLVEISAEPGPVMAKEQVRMRRRTT